jgi:hypothetical protein
LKIKKRKEVRKMKTIYSFTDKLTDGRTLTVSQEENGIYNAVIRDINNTIESGTIQSTMADIWRWFNTVTVKKV